MAETKILEREYIIPLRRAWINVPHYERTGKAIKTIKKFIAKHMKVVDRDVSKVKLDVYFNNELWFRGRRHPPAKVKVRARKDGDIVKVEFVETPEHVKFLKAKHGKMHVKPEKKEEKEAPTPEEVEKRVEEKEKEKSVAEANIKEFKAESKAEKHSTKPEKAQRPQRMALQK
ncbi:50S ribosomal protein L31e [Candidatus Pacearchaeota archaeon]|nr:50S ribosomal protein L31e [Candidatus Pacearchaeota archaeon]